MDGSDAGSSASRAYNSSGESIENTLVVESAPNVSALGLNSSPAISIAVTPGASVQVDHAAPSDAPLFQQIVARANYSDATSEEDDVVSNAAGTLILTLTQSKTITSIDVDIRRSTSGSAQGSTHSTDIQEVRIIGA